MDNMERERERERQSAVKLLKGMFGLDHVV